METKYLRESQLISHYDANINYYSTINPDSVLQILQGFYVEMENLTRVLDVGCGDGRLSHFLSRNGVPVDGVDYSQPRIDKANQIALKEGLSCNFYCNDLNFFLEESEEQYDLIAIFEVLEHLENPESVIDSCKKLLSENGKIIGSVPLNMPYVAHLQVFEDLEAVTRRLKPRGAVEATGHAYCAWINE